MPLPSLLMPAEVPAFLIAGHGSIYGSVFAPVAMATGHRRLRRVCTIRPQVVQVSLLLERDEMTAFHAWFRDDLVSGEREFAARVKDQGAGQLWYAAAWVGMYEAEALHKGRWRVAGELLLIGDGQATTPAGNEFAAEVTVPVLMSASLNVTKQLAAEIVVAVDAEVVS